MGRLREMSRWNGIQVTQAVGLLQEIVAGEPDSARLRRRARDIAAQVRQWLLLIGTSGPVPLTITELLRHWPQAPTLLVELARLEWACHEVYQAADSSPLAPEQLQAMVSEDPSRVTIQFHQTARLLSFPVPVHRVWQALQPDASPDEGVDLPLPEQQTGVVVTRREGMIQVTPLNWLDYRLLESLSQGSSVASIERFAREAESGFDFTRLMTTLLNLQVMAGISVKEGV